ncbi:hypothetical protein MMPV_004499 [Pyropia vietnamensis]
MTVPAEVAARPLIRVAGIVAAVATAVVAVAVAAASFGANDALRVTIGGGIDGSGVDLMTTGVAMATDQGGGAAEAAAASHGQTDPATKAFEQALAANRLAAMPPLPVPSLFTRHPGYFTLHVGKGLASGKMLLEVPATALGVPFIVTALTAKGDAEESHAGQQAHPWYWPNVFAFREAPGRVAEGAAAALDLYRPLMALRSTEGAGSNTSAAESLREGYFPGWLKTFPARPGSAAGSYLFDATTWLDAGFFVISDDDGRNSLEEWEEEHRLVKGAAYPRNLELDVQVRTRSTTSLGTSVLSPENYFARVVHYSLIALPEMPMEPRLADVRVGYYGQTFQSIDAIDGRSTKRTYINRWDLSKRDHITYHVDPSVPLAWRRTVKEGVEEWNRAFVAAGHPPNTVRGLLPGDPDWPADYAAGDSRYSSITWAPTVGNPPAYGPSDWDPRSGEILNADILLPANFLQSYANRANIYLGGGTAAANLTTKRGGRRPAAPWVDAVMMAKGAALVRTRYMADAIARAETPTSAASIRASAGTPSAIDKAMATYAREAMKWLVMHEVGHTLGLTHNFRGSTSIPFAKLSDKAYVTANGLGGSVMDYVPALVRAKPADHSFYYSPTVGVYDVEAIRYGYSSFQSDAKRVAVAQALARNGAFATDLDEPGTSGIDPLTSYGDLSATPLDYHEEVLTVTRQTLVAGLRATAASPGRSWVDFGNDAMLIVERGASSIAYATKFIGGSVPSRADSDGTSGAAAVPVVDWVDAATQERALKLVLREISPYGNGLLSAPAAARIGPYLLDQICFNGGPTDQCLGVESVDVATAWRQYRGDILDSLLTPNRLAQLSEARVIADGGKRLKGPSVSEVLSRVTSTFFDLPAGTAGSAAAVRASGRGGGAGVDPSVAALAHDAQAQWVGHLLLRAHAADEEVALHPTATAAVFAELNSIHKLTSAPAKFLTPKGGKERLAEEAHLAGLAAITAWYATPAAPA